MSTSQFVFDLQFTAVTPTTPLRTLNEVVGVVDGGTSVLPPLMSRLSESSAPVRLSGTGSVLLATSIKR